MRAKLAGRVRHPLVEVHCNQQGQTAIFFLLSLLFLCMFFALALDVGLWHFGHRWAQNEAEAAALAAAGRLPSPGLSDPSFEAFDWLTRNGIDNVITQSPCNDENAYGMYWNQFGDVDWDTVRICIRRTIPAFFARLFGVDSVYVSATAVASAGPVVVANVMPWAVFPPLPSCPPPSCSSGPWGLDPNRQYVLRHGGGGDLFGIEACGSGPSNYQACVRGTKLSDQFFEEGATHPVVQYTPVGTDTLAALNLRFPGSSPCSKADFTNPAPIGNCQLRLVPVPILCKSPLVASCRDGNGTYRVLGIATFGIASWQSSAPYEVRGWFLQNAQPPSRPLQRIGPSINPFAPILPALVQ